MSAPTPLRTMVLAARERRGRRWEPQHDRCTTCRHWTAGFCSEHRAETKADGGCALHLPRVEEAARAMRRFAGAAMRNVKQ